MSVFAAALHLTSVTLDLIEMHQRQTDRADALARLHRRIVRLLRARWLRQQKLVLAHHTLADLRPRESLDAEISSLILRALLPGAIHSALDGLVTDYEVGMYDGTLRAAIAAGARGTARDLDMIRAKVDTGNLERDWIRQRGFDKLSNDIDRVTVDKLRVAVSDTYGQGGAYADLVRSIKDTFSGFSDERADLIAQTELNAAYNRGGLEFAIGVDAKTKTWNPLGDNVCPICEENADEGNIPILDQFQSGADSPPEHPRCECVLDFGFLDP